MVGGRYFCLENACVTHGLHMVHLRGICFMSDSNRAQIVVVGGPKGGTTKSTVALNLAATAAETGLRVCVLDCDCNEGEGNQSSKTFSDNREMYYIDAAKKLKMGMKLDEALGDALPFADKTLINALKLYNKKSDKTDPPMWSSQLQKASNSKMFNTIRRIEGDYDLIVVDTSGYSSPAFQSSAIIADVVLVPASNSFFEISRLPAVSDFLTQYEQNINMNPNSDDNYVIDCRVLLSKVERFNLSEVVKLREELMNSGINLGICSTMISNHRKFIEANKWGLTQTEVGAPSKNVAQFQMLLDEVMGRRDAYSLRQSISSIDAMSELA